MNDTQMNVTDRKTFADATPGPRKLEPASTARAPGFLARLGLVVVHPRWALTLAGDREHAGRSGSDLILAIAVLLLATQLRALATAVWLGAAVQPGLGVRAAIRVLTGALTLDLGLLLIGALAVFALAGARRNLGRAFDLACVAVLPLVFVEIAATAIVRVAGITAVPVFVGWLLTGVSYAWMGALIALATRVARSGPVRVPPPPAAVVRPARRIGWAIAALAALGVAVHGAWVVRNLDLVKPMTSGDHAPAFALPRIGADGALGEPVTLAQSSGKVRVIEFWATWCHACMSTLPRLDKLARTHADVEVIAINLDDPAAARALFDQRGYAMTLVADDGQTYDRYGVSAIPHIVIVGRHGEIREVVRGSGTDIAALVESIRTSE